MENPNLSENKLNDHYDDSENDLRFDIRTALTQPTHPLPVDFIRKKRHFGNNFVFCWIREEPQCTVGPHWVWFFMNLLVLTAIGLVTYFFVATKASVVMQGITLGLLGWEILIYVYLGFKNPGIVTATDPTDPSIYELAKQPQFCSRCKVLRGKDIYHCKDCNVCIQGHHHHCTWIGKCVGRGNIYGYFIFIVSTVIFLMYCLGFTLYQLIRDQQM